MLFRIVSSCKWRGSCNSRDLLRHGAWSNDGRRMLRKGNLYLLRWCLRTLINLPTCVLILCPSSPSISPSESACINSAQHRCLTASSSSESPLLRPLANKRRNKGSRLNPRRNLAHVQDRRPVPDVFVLWPLEDKLGSLKPKHQPSLNPQPNHNRRTYGCNVNFQSLTIKNADTSFLRFTPFPSFIKPGKRMM